MKHDLFFWRELGQTSHITNSSIRFSPSLWLLGILPLSLLLFFQVCLHTYHKSNVAFSRSRQSSPSGQLVELQRPERGGVLFLLFCAFLFMSFLGLWPSSLLQMGWGFLTQWTYTYSTPCTKNYNMDQVVGVCVLVVSEWKEFPTWHNHVVRVWEKITC